LCNLTGNRPQSATFHTANVASKARKTHGTELNYLELILYF